MKADELQTAAPTTESRREANGVLLYDGSVPTAVDKVGAATSGFLGIVS
jgi:hypothetical protein